MDLRFSIIVNPELKNQATYEIYLALGFDALGYEWASSSKYRDWGDVNVCIGPHYAMTECIESGKPTIYIDRCFWGGDLEYVTIGWLREGRMRYPINAPGDRNKPELSDWKYNDESKAIYLMDWGPYDDEYKLCSKEYTTTLRVHPATGKKQPSLEDHLEGHGVAVGRRTSALVSAAILGYPVITFDNRAPVFEIAGHDILDIRRPDRTQWLNNMSYAQWSGKEIETGEALQYVLNHRPNG